MYKPKIRIQLRNPDGSLVSDRMVDQYEELLRGPKESHNGPVTLEVTLTKSADYDRVIDYINGLRGTPKDKEPMIGTKPLKNPSPEVDKGYQTLLSDLLTRKGMEDVTDYLREINFRLITFDMLKNLMSPKAYKKVCKAIPEKYRNRFELLVRMTHMDKDPRKDVYDTTLLVGITHTTKRLDRYFTFYNGDFKVIQKPWKTTNPINFKKRKVLVKFPDEMTIQERIDWRKIHEKLKKDHDIKKKALKFYKRWLPLIKNLKKD